MGDFNYQIHIKLVVSQVCGQVVRFLLFASPASHALHNRPVQIFKFEIFNVTIIVAPVKAYKIIYTAIWMQNKQNEQNKQI